MRVAVFGGSFDPPHVGHVLAVLYASLTAEIDETLVVPVFSHPFDKDLAPFAHRVEMARLAFAGLSGASVSAVEAELEVPSLTVRTLEHLWREHPDWKLRLLVGSDALHDASKWTSWDRVRELAPLIVLGRAGAEHDDAPAPVVPNVSSSRVRTLLRSRSSDARAAEELGRSVPESVLRYVDEHGLYR
jgi:nicotinate-nucleotide adenylyltransferase